MFDPIAPRPFAPPPLRGPGLSTRQWVAVLATVATITLLASGLTAFLLTRPSGGGKVSVTAAGRPIVAPTEAASSAVTSDSAAPSSGGVDATTAGATSIPTGAGEVVVNPGPAGSTPTRPAATVATNAPTSPSVVSSASAPPPSAAASSAQPTLSRPAIAASRAPGAQLSVSAPKLDEQASPSFGSANLSATFNPDPYSVAMTQGGAVNASYLGHGCAGFASSAPALRITFSGATTLLRVYFIGAGNAALIVNDPYGNYYCADNSFGTVNPTIDFSNPAAGSYTVWVATAVANTTVNGTLSVTKNAASHP